MTTETVYAIYLPINRPGEFKFLTHTQAFWSSDLSKVKKEFKGVIPNHMSSYDPPLTRKEALQDLGTPVLYKLIIEKINIKQLDEVTA